MECLACRECQNRRNNLMAAPSRSALLQRVLIACAVLLFAGLVGLGTWQVKRLFWKLDLIDRVTQRVNAPATAAPAPPQWPLINAAADEYRHVRLRGSFLYNQTTRVQAVTELGAGFWLLTPLRQTDGIMVLINRGFVPAGSRRADSISRTLPPVITITGLLRMSEPGGAFLRKNDPAGNRWYSRDVAAIAASHALSGVAPYFVDADAASAAAASAAAAGRTGERPVGGLTVIAFANSHLVYAVTWYALALMVAGAAIWVVRDERRRQRGAGSDGMEREDSNGGID